MITALINNRAVILIGQLDNRAANLIDLEHSTQCFGKTNLKIITCPLYNWPSLVILVQWYPSPRGGKARYLEIALGQCGAHENESQAIIKIYYTASVFPLKSNG